MATRYWVGGTDTWNTTLTTHWSAASGISFTASCTGTALTTVGNPALVVGMTVFVTSTANIGTIVSGSGNNWVVSIGGTRTSQTMSAATVGASVPTSTDDVVFDAGSGIGTLSYQVGITTGDTCNNITASNQTGTLVFANPQTLNIYGSLTFIGPLISSSFTGLWNFVGTATGRTLSASGIAIGGTVTINGVGIDVTLASTLACAGLTFTNGTFNTNNFAITLTAAVTNTGTGTTVVNLGSSAISVGTNWLFAASTGLTLNAGTSNISFTGNQPQFSMGGQTFYDIQTTNTAYNGSLSISNLLLTGPGTCNNLTIAPLASAGSKAIIILNSLVVNGTLTYASPAVNIRLLITIGNRVTYLQSTITCAAVSLNNVDFWGVIFAGAASPISGTNFGDCGYNSGITFPAAKTVYWNLAAGGSFYSTAWATTSGGTPAIANFPLPQDTAIIENTGLNTSATISTQYIQPNLNVTRTLAWTFNQTAGLSMTGGSWIAMPAVTTISGSVTLTGYNQTYNIAGNVAAISVATLGTCDINLTGNCTSFGLAAGIANLTSNLTSTGAITWSAQLTGGSGGANACTLSLNSYTLSGTTILIGGSTKLGIFGTGAVKLNSTAGGTIININSQFLNFSGTNRTFILNNTGAIATTIANNVPNYNTIPQFKIISGTYTLTLPSIIDSIDFTGFNGTLPNTALTIYGSVVIPSSGGTFTAGANAWTFTPNLGTTNSFTTNGRTIDWPITYTAVNYTAVLQIIGGMTMGSTRAFTFNIGTLSLDAGTTTTVGSFLSTTTPLKYLTSTVPGTQATIAKASGTTTATYLYVIDSNATGGTWDASSVTNQSGGNNTGWIIKDLPSNGLFQMFLV